jgi:hypothetical protein
LDIHLRNKTTEATETWSWSKVEATEVYFKLVSPIHTRSSVSLQIVVCVPGPHMAHASHEQRQKQQGPRGGRPPSQIEHQAAPYADLWWIHGWSRRQRWNLWGGEGVSSSTQVGKGVVERGVSAAARGWWWCPAKRGELTTCRAEEAARGRWTIAGVDGWRLQRIRETRKQIGITARPSDIGRDSTRKLDWHRVNITTNRPSKQVGTVPGGDSRAGRRHRENNKFLARNRSAKPALKIGVKPEFYIGIATSSFYPHARGIQVHVWFSTQWVGFFLAGMKILYLCPRTRNEYMYVLIYFYLYYIKASVLMVVLRQ